jgi:hypothetical protein
MPCFIGSCLKAGVDGLGAGCSTERAVANNQGIVDSNKRDEVTMINHVLVTHQEKAVCPAVEHWVTHSCDDLGTRRN